MRVDTIEEIIDKLIGPINPTGEHSVDVDRLENLDKYGELCQRLVNKLNHISKTYELSYERSVKDIVDKSNEILNNLKD